MAIRVICAEGAAAYIWRSGDTIERVAERFNTTTAEIRAINPGVVYTRLQPGELICVPTDDIVCPGNSTYRVQDGDNIVEIAQKLGLRPYQLLAANPYIDPDQLAVGQLICVPQSGGTAQAVAQAVARAAARVVVVARQARWGRPCAPEIRCCAYSTGTIFPTRSSMS